MDNCVTMHFTIPFSMFCLAGRRTCGMLERVMGLDTLRFSPVDPSLASSRDLNRGRIVPLRPCQTLPFMFWCRLSFRRIPNPNPSSPIISTQSSIRERMWIQESFLSTIGVITRRLSFHQLESDMTQPRCPILPLLFHSRRPLC